MGPAITVLRALNQAPVRSPLWQTQTCTSSFFKTPQPNSSGTAAAAAKFVNALPITSVKDLVYQILARIRQTNGRIKTLTIMAHGLDYPSGPDDPYMLISIGRDDITVERALKDPLLPLLAAVLPI
jgi:hypothetical protein